MKMFGWHRLSTRAVQESFKYLASVAGKTSRFPTTNQTRCVRALSISSVRASINVSAELAHVSPNHAKLYEMSIERPEEFWGPLGKERIKWIEDFHTVTASDLSKGKHAWFLGGKLNISGKYAFSLYSMICQKYSPERFHLDIGNPLLSTEQYDT